MPEKRAFGPPRPDDDRKIRVNLSVDDLIEIEMTLRARLSGDRLRLDDSPDAMKAHMALRKIQKALSRINE